MCGGRIFEGEAAKAVARRRGDGPQPQPDIVGRLERTRSDTGSGRRRGRCDRRRLGGHGGKNDSGELRPCGCRRRSRPRPSGWQKPRAPPSISSSTSRSPRRSRRSGPLISFGNAPGGPTCRVPSRCSTVSAATSRRDQEMNSNSTRLHRPPLLTPKAIPCRMIRD